MTKRRQIFIAVFGVLVLAAPLYADMMPLSASGGRGGQPACSPQPTGTFSEEQLAWGDCRGIADLGVLPVGPLPVVDGDIEQACERQAAPILSDGQNSFSLCLYALLGLGLCRSAPWVKRLHLGAIPEWYHDGGPSQIGHSLAISPDCLCSTPVYCFVQPEDAAQDCIPQYRQEIIVSLWRKSQFAPEVIASRGPPLS